MDDEIDNDLFALIVDRSDVDNFSPMDDLDLGLDSNDLLRTPSPSLKLDLKPLLPSIPSFASNSTFGSDLIMVPSFFPHAPNVPDLSSSIINEAFAAFAAEMDSSNLTLKVASQEDQGTRKRSRGGGRRGDQPERGKGDSGLKGKKGTLPRFGSIIEGVMREAEERKSRDSQV